MIVCISGLSGCGKNTVGELLSRKLGLKQITFSFKDEAKARGISLMELQELASTDSNIDKKFDERLVREARKGNCIVSTWLGSWMIENADFKVWLKASAEERAKRVAARDNMSFQEALAHVEKRDESNRQRYKKYYGINIDDHSNFDLEINTRVFTPELIVEIIVEAIKLKTHDATLDYCNKV